MISFDQVKVPKEYLLGEEGKGFIYAMQGLDGGRINIASCSLGTANAALQTCLEYVKDRKLFGQTLADFQMTQFKLADMATELTASQQMVRLAAFKLDQASLDPSNKGKQKDATLHCAMAKRIATDICFEICNEALQIHGGYGYIKEYPLERFVRDVRVHQILEGTNEIMRVIVGRQLLED
jgi:alkylation response protein AidB-like acyl-CoA dehydrogenase